MVLLDNIHRIQHKIHIYHHLCHTALALNAYCYPCAFDFLSCAQSKAHRFYPLIGTALSTSVYSYACFALLIKIFNHSIIPYSNIHVVLYHCPIIPASLLKKKYPPPGLTPRNAGGLLIFSHRYLYPISEGHLHAAIQFDRHPVNRRVP